MPKTTFNYGSLVTAEWLNAIQNLTFVDNPQNDGQYPKITNNDLSGAPGQIKSEWTAFREALAVSAGTGLQVVYNGGIVTLLNGSQLTIAPGAIAVPNNSTVFVFLNDAGTLSQSTIRPVRALMLAQVTTVSGAVTAIVDLRPRFQLQPVFSSVRLFGGGGGQGDYALNSGSTTFDQEEYAYRDFSLGSSATLNVRGFAYIRCAGNVVIGGNIIVSQASAGGGNYGASVTGSAGFVGGGIGGLSGAGPGGASGNRVSSITYSYLTAPYGSGGASGFLAITGGGGAVVAGGDGGGGLIIEAAGSITIQPGASIIARGTNGQNGSLDAGATGGSSGGGGGSGGLICLRSLNSIVVSGGATLDVRGNNGGNGAGSNAGRGFGGGGGVVALAAPNINTTGSTILLSGGTNGTSNGVGNQPGGGSGGSFGGLGGYFPNVAAQSGVLIVRNLNLA